MSTWVVSKDHVDLLATAAEVFGLTADPEQTGAMLWEANWHSYAHTYPHHKDVAALLADVRAYQFSSLGIEDPLYLLMQIDCFSCQACDPPDWSGSDAERITDALTAAVCAAGHLTPWTFRTLAAYEAKPWGVWRDTSGSLVLTRGEAAASRARATSA